MPVVISCRKCNAEHRLTDQQMLEHLQSRGMLRREKSPRPDLVRELFTTLSDEIACQACAAIGVLVGDDWEDEWADEVRCLGCQTAIPAERLEIFPDTKFCPSCQRRKDAGEPVGEETEYCERCGGVMKLAKRGGRGLAGYRMICSDCGK